MLKLQRLSFWILDFEPGEFAKLAQKIPNTVDVSAGLKWKNWLLNLIPSHWKLAEIDLVHKQAKVYFTEQYYVWIFGSKQTRVYYFEKEFDFSCLELAINWLVETVEGKAA